MKNSQLHITLIIILGIFLFESSFSQKELTLEDAVLKRWSSLRPERLIDLKWNNKQDFYSYRDSKYIYLYDVENILKDTISLAQLNTSFSGEETLTSLPNITWLNSHSFRFKHNNKYYIYNIQRGQKAYFLFDVPNDSQHIDFNNWLSNI